VPFLGFSFNPGPTRRAKSQNLNEKLLSGLEIASCNDHGPWGKLFV
jgi:hypothetical protein